MFAQKTKQNKCRFNKENHKWKEDYITITQETRLEKVKVETEKIKKLLSNIPRSNIIELNEPIYAEAKLVCDEIGILLRKSNRNTKFGWEIRLNGQVKIQRK